MIKTSHRIQLCTACAGLDWFEHDSHNQVLRREWGHFKDEVNLCLHHSNNVCKHKIHSSLLHRSSSHSVHVEALKRRWWEFGMKRVLESILPCQGLCFLQACVWVGACVSRWERGSDSSRAAFCLGTELVLMPWRRSARLLFCVCCNLGETAFLLQTFSRDSSDRKQDTDTVSCREPWLAKPCSITCHGPCLLNLINSESRASSPTAHLFVNDSHCVLLG